MTVSTWNSWILTVIGKLNGLWVALISCLVPAGYIALTLTTNKPSAAVTQLLLDPGPRHLCYSFTDLARNDSLVTNRSISECSLIPRYAGCPTWQFSSFNAGSDHEEHIAGGNGSLINITVVNNARSVCDAVETSFDYLYPGCGIEKLSNISQFNLLDFDEWLFEYDIAIHPTVDIAKPSFQNRTQSWNETQPTKEFGCHNQSQRISTDFVYQWPDPKCSNTTDCSLLNNTISVIHYHPQQNTTLGPFVGTGGYDLALNQTPQLIPGQTTRVALDFKKIFQPYRKLLCHDGADPPWIHVHIIRIVSNNVNTDSTIDIQNVRASLSSTLTKDSYWQPAYKPFDGIPDYCPGAPASSVSKNNLVMKRFAA